MKRAVALVGIPWATSTALLVVAATLAATGHPSAYPASLLTLAVGVMAFWSTTAYFYGYPHAKDTK